MATNPPAVVHQAAAGTECDANLTASGSNSDDQVCLTSGGLSWVRERLGKWWRLPFSWSRSDAVNSCEPLPDDIGMIVARLSASDLDARRGIRIICEYLVKHSTWPPAEKLRVWQMLVKWYNMRIFGRIDYAIREHQRGPLDGTIDLGGEGGFVLRFAVDGKILFAVGPDLVDHRTGMPEPNIDAREFREIGNRP